MMRRNRAFFRFLVLCLCVGGRIAIEDTRASSSGYAADGPTPVHQKEKLSLPPSSSPLMGHSWKYPRDEGKGSQHHLPRASLTHHGREGLFRQVIPSVLGSTLVESAETKYNRRPFDYLKDGATFDDAVSAPLVSNSYLRAGESSLLRMSPADKSNAVDVDEPDDVGQQLNLHEAQLARLHGLGPAEIAALYNWQQRMRFHSSASNPNYGVQDSSSGEAAKRKINISVKNLEASPDRNDRLSAPPPPGLSEPGNAAMLNETQFNNNVPVTWPKRSTSVETKSNNKLDKEGKNRNGFNGRKEKSEQQTSNGGKTGKGNGKSSRRQQQSQESVSPVFMAGENMGNINKPGKEGISSYEHGRASSAGMPPVSDVSRINRNLATQFLLRSPRENRQYDVPIIECPPAEDGMERFACPTPDIVGRYRCIDDHVLCDGFIDCPGGEDEDGQACMFYKTMKAHLDLVADALLRWVRGR